MPSSINSAIRGAARINFKEITAILYLLKKTVFFFLGVGFLACLMAAYAAESKLKGITVDSAYLVVFGKNAKSGAGYFVISNNNTSPVVLNGVNANFGVAMLHKTNVDKKGIAKMKHQKNIIIPGKGGLKLEPGGIHVMFIDIETELNENRKYPVTLLFEGQGSIEVDFMLNSPNKNQTARKHTHSHNHDH